MFSIGFWELALIVVVAILVINPRDLPRILYNIGEAFGKLRQQISGIQEQWQQSIKELDHIDDQKDIK